MIMIVNIAIRIAVVCIEVAESATGLDFGVGREHALKFFDGDYCERETSDFSSQNPPEQEFTFQRRSALPVGGVFRSRDASGM
jgi:hypothetical protein